MRLAAFCLSSFCTALLSLSTSQAAQVYKWVDEDGQVHYSAKKPADAKAKSMYIPNSQPVEEPAPVSPANTDAECQTMTCRMNKYVDENPIPKRKKSAPSLNIPASKVVHKPTDADIVSKCKKDRDNYCDKGAAEIRRIQQEKAEMQRAADHQRRFEKHLRPDMPPSRWQ